MKTKYDKPLKMLASFNTEEEQENILKLKKLKITVATLDNSPTDTPVFVIDIDSIEESHSTFSMSFDVHDFIEVCYFLRNILHKTNVIY